MLLMLLNNNLFVLSNKNLYKYFIGDLSSKKYSVFRKNKSLSNFGNSKKEIPADKPK